MIAIAPHAEGCLLSVRAQPGARKAGVVGEQAGALKVALTAPPEDGRANQAMTDLLRGGWSSASIRARPLGQD